MILRRMIRYVAATGAVLFATPSHAHVVLETREAAVGTYYKAVFQVGHGCDGAATTRLRVAIPEHVISIKPMQKAGWTLETSKADYARSYTQHGRAVTSGVREVVWSGGPLADENYDEFVLTAYLTDTLKPGTTLYFPVVQDCEKGSLRWTEIPTGGQPVRGMPAPALKLRDGEHTHHH